MYRVLVKPFVTEKAVRTDRLYVFSVNPKATKQEIKKAIESLYQVTVEEVRTVVIKGKTKYVGKKRMPKTLPLKKKAYITLRKGEIPDVKVQ